MKPPAVEATKIAIFKGKKSGKSSIRMNGGFRWWMLFKCLLINKMTMLPESTGINWRNV